MAGMISAATQMYPLNYFGFGSRHVCVCMYSHYIWQSVDQPGKVANNPARHQLNREKWMFACPHLRLEFGLARQDRPSRPAS